MSGPWVPVEPLASAAFADVRRRAIVDCCKWDPQVGDVCVIARTPLVITRAAWDAVVRLAETLANETLAAERELIDRPELHRVLGVPRAARRALRRIGRLGPSAGVARIVRFDFHFTTDGWRISEANCDVPGGLNEASGLPAAIGPHYAWAVPVGDPADAYARAIAAGAGPRSTVALVHATAFSDDQQMMSFVARRLEARGVAPQLASPSHLRWRDGRVHLDSAWFQGPLDAVVRFFPAEWLGDLPGACGWPMLFAGSRTPLSNPAAAILTQSKRFPLVWDRLQTRLPAWRAHLPETRDPREAPWRTSDEWIVKPAFGRVGEGIGMPDAIGAAELRRIRRQAHWWPGRWIAQRRFRALPVEIGGRAVFPCLGVYTLDGRVVGAYGRLATVPLVDARAADAAVLAA
ncbi:MAG TPA: glutathionylspermidine synthase family protein [Vicinamibacterales bacterium]|nr:glutathionylspermidine synthase family protein [Vicinamibacterales bacterium]